MLNQEAKAGQIPDLFAYKMALSQLEIDLNLLYSQAGTLGGFVVDNFNEVQALVQEIQAKVARVKSLLADYRIYSLRPQKGFFYFGDTFNDLAKVDPNKGLLTKDMCSFDAEAGITTLPLEQENVREIKQVVINVESNGVAGNNNEYGVPRHNNIRDLFDGNPDTWYEYERVGEFTPPLVLSLTLVLGKAEVVNNIRIVSVNFGTKTWPTLRILDTSEDGKDFISVDQDLPLVDWGTETEEDLFVLGPGTKLSGTSSFFFTPRKAKYIRMIIEQPSSYIIDTVNATKERWAIGLKEVQVRGLSFKDSGEFISKDFVSSSAIMKVAIATNQTPGEGSTIGAVTHSFSLDTGQSWNDLAPMQFSRSDLQEIVNTEDLVSAGESGSNVIKYRCGMSRLTEGFANAGLGAQEEDFSEMLSFPENPPYLFSLKNVPVSGSLQLINPLGGECAEEPTTPYFVGLVPTLEEEQIVMGLPFDNLDDLTIRVKVGLTEWSRARTLAYEGSIGKECFMIDQKARTLNFGDGSITSQPKPGQPVYLWFDRERLLLEPGNPIATKLRFPSTGIKSKVNIYREGPKELVQQEVLRKGLSRIQLSHTFLYFPDPAEGEEPDPDYFHLYYLKEDGTVEELPVDEGPFRKYLEYIDGVQEFYGYARSEEEAGIGYAVEDGCYSIDKRLGLICVAYNEEDPTNLDAFPLLTRSTYIDYQFHRRTYIPEDKWNFASSSVQEIEIDPSVLGVETGVLAADTLENGSLVWWINAVTTTDIVVKAIIPKSIVFSDQDGLPVSDWTEVPFIDGQAEFEVLDTKTFTFSVDYAQGKLYSPETPFKTSGSAYYQIQFQFTNYFAEYSIGLPLREDTHWSLEGEKEVRLSDAYALELSTAVKTADNKRGIRAIYRYAVDFRNALKELEPYYSPVLQEYRLIAVSEEGLAV
jgi:hypothetical protein